MSEIKKTFSVVEFLSGKVKGGVEVISSSWIVSKGKCLFPNKCGVTSISSRIAKHAIPRSKWKSFKIKICETGIEDYDKARRHCERWCRGKINLETDSDHTSKRRKTDKAFPDFVLAQSELNDSSSSEDSSSEDTPLSSPEKNNAPASLTVDSISSGLAPPIVELDFSQ
ncbi:unnamed protein product, partial [Allacma fusca]